MEIIRASGASRGTVRAHEADSGACGVADVGGGRLMYTHDLAVCLGRSGTPNTPFIKIGTEHWVRASSIVRIAPDTDTDSYVWLATSEQTGPLHARGWSVGALVATIHGMECQSGPVAAPRAPEED